MTTFPTTIDSLTNPTGTNPTTAPSHASQHTNANDAIAALEAKVGVNSSGVATSLDYKVTNNLGKPLGLTGATSATRYVGATASVAPTSGTFLQGDFVVTQAGSIFICTVAGSPGTWVQVVGSGGSVSLTMPDYLIYKSGSNYLARNTATGVDDYTSTNAASVVQSAHDALGVAGLIELKSGVTYNATTMVTLSTNGVCVRSRQQSGEDESTLWMLNSSLAAGQAAFRLTGSGAAIGGISVEVNGNADYGIDLRSAGGMMFDANCKEANIANFYVDGPNGAARCIFWNLRSDNPTASGGINFKLDGSDHIAWGLRATGAATNGYALWMDTSRCQIASAHITAANDAAGCVFISGRENRLDTVYMDTGPNGINGQAHVLIQGSGNHISALVQNAATRTAVNVTAVALQSGTTYRFTCSSAHGYAVGDAVWLQGFASSSGFFQTSTDGSVLVSAVSDSTHFDADLAASTTFTDAVGTAKGITKYGVLFQKASAGSFVQGNEVTVNYQGVGAGVNDGPFYYAVGFLTEANVDPTNMARFAANRVTANAANATRCSNLEATWGTITNSDKVFVDAWQYQNDTTTPMVWRTKASGLTAASTASTWTITHGLAGLPGSVQVTARADVGTQTWYVSSVTATSIVVTASGSITNAKWAWKAEM